MKTLRDDTIAAIATPIGEGGIAVIRISGPNAVEIADLGFRGRELLAAASTHTAHYGKFLNPHGIPVDEVVSTVFRSPHSYTGEDVVEISCHGGILVTKTILSDLLNYGARQAEPGEFTKRAFLNGRLDLAQAEAVADLIKARSEAAQATSLRQLEGRLSKEIRGLRDRLVEVMSLVELELDFVEEGLEFIDKERIQKEISSVAEKVKRLMDSYETGRIQREGARVVLCGRPNVGKSSIFNMLLNTDRAIVTHIPGTTRDTLEESILVDGILFTLSDTAGLRESIDIIESEGINRTNALIETADILLFIIDLHDGLTTKDVEIFTKLCGISKGKIICIGNKSDLMNEINTTTSVYFQDHEFVVASALTADGMSRIKERLSQSIKGVDGSASERSIAITNIRHVKSLRDSLCSLESASTALKEGQTGEVIAAELRSASRGLGEIVGEVSSEEVLNHIFSKFCIGK